MSTTYAQLLLRRDTDANRLTCTPAIGEPFWTTDLEELWVGDGATAGGVFAGSAALSQAMPDQNALAATGSVAVAPTKRFTSCLQRLTAIGAGSGAFTITVTLARPKALPGATVRVYMELPASPNPTVNIVDLTTSTVLATYTGGAQAIYPWADFQIGPDGAWHLTARGTN